jgi:hypothetical protein
VVAVTWSADGGWLAVAVATGGGVKTQVWVVRPDGGDARLLAGGPEQHAELGAVDAQRAPGGRRRSRAPRLDEPTVAYLCDPSPGELTPLATAS